MRTRPHEIAFGAVGRFWAGETAWEQIDAAGFRDFDRPGFAKLACNFSLRPYGAERTLVSYECRTLATDAEARGHTIFGGRLPLEPINVMERGMLNATRHALERRRT